MSIVNISYKASPTMQKFHQSKAFVRGVRGPIGSGKSVGMCLELFRRLKGQEKSRDGFRKSRWAVIRNTYPELETTTIKTWLDWFPEEYFGNMSRRVPICHNMEFEDVKAEVYFIAMDRPEDVKKLLSLELTGIFFNEARELPLSIVMTGCDRVGRYPKQSDRPENITKDNWPTWYGVIMDTNSPDEDHWWAAMAGDAELPEDFTIPENWELFAQPPAAFEKRVDGKIVWVLNPDAENLENLPTNYYRNLISGKPNQHVRVYVGNKYGTLSDGKRVYPEFSPDIHISKEPIKHIAGRMIHVGLDFGQTPSAVFGEQTLDGQWHDMHELVTEGVGPTRFARILKAEIATRFSGLLISEHFTFWGDPSGAFQQSGTDKTYFEILQGEGIPVKPAPTQNPTTRIEAGREPLETMLTGGRPGYLIDPSCKVLIKGFNSGYHYPKISSSGSIRHHDKPLKNKYSHPHEARQYAMCGAGYALKIVNKEKKSNGKTYKAKTTFNPLG